jgi:HEAT repeat protein
VARAPDPEVPPGADTITRSLIELKSSDQGKRKRALERLQRTAPDGRVDQVVGALVPLLEDDDGFFVSDVIKTLAVWRSPEAMAALIGRLRENRHFVRSDAIKALGKYRDLAAAEAIVTVIKEDGFAVEDALKAMGEVAEPAVITLLRSPDSRVRGQACHILAEIGGQKTLIEMQSLPTDADFGVRVAAQDAWKRIVARVGPPPKPVRGKTGKGTAR